MGKIKWWLFKKLDFGVFYYIVKVNYYNIAYMVGYKKVLFIGFVFKFLK